MHITLYCLFSPQRSRKHWNKRTQLWRNTLWQTRICAQRVVCLRPHLTPLSPLAWWIPTWQTFCFHRPNLSKNRGGAIQRQKRHVSSQVIQCTDKKEKVKKQFI